jgi:hypothetical protein
MNCCKGKVNISYGFKWVYEEDYNNNILNKFIPKIRQHKNIVQLDMKYNLINIWESVNEINKQLGIEISLLYECCNQNLMSSNNYRWLYREDYESNNFIKSKLNGNAKPILQLSLDDQLIKEWTNKKYIKEELNLNPSTIKSVCNGTIKTNVYKGYKWMYKEDYEKLACFN